MLRPPTIAIALSATMSLLWERRLTRDGSMRKSLQRLPRPRNGLKARISMLGCADSCAIAVSRPTTGDVVEQHAHAHAAIRGSDDAVGEQVPADVGVPDEVLQIEGPFREVGQRQARYQRLGPVAHVHDTRLPGMLGCRRLEEAAERRRVVLLKRGRRRPRVFRVVGRAASRDRKGASNAPVPRPSRDVGSERLMLRSSVQWMRRAPTSGHRCHR